MMSPDATNNLATFYRALLADTIRPQTINGNFIIKNQAGSDMLTLYGSTQNATFHRAVVNMTQNILDSIKCRTASGAITLNNQTVSSITTFNNDRSMAVIGDITAPNITTITNKLSNVTSDATSVTFTGKVNINHSADEAVLNINNATTVNVGVSMFAGNNCDNNSIRSVQYRNISTGTSAEMRFLCAANESNYMSFTVPSSTNAGTFFGVTKSSSYFKFSSGGTSTRNLYIGPLTSNSLNLCSNGLVRATIASNDPSAMARLYCLEGMPKV